MFGLTRKQNAVKKNKHLRQHPCDAANTGSIPETRSFTQDDSQKEKLKKKKPLPVAHKGC